MTVPVSLPPTDISPVADWPASWIPPDTVTLTGRALAHWIRQPGWLLGWQRRSAAASATTSAVRQLFGDPGRDGGAWADQHALPLAVGWPLPLVAVFPPLSVRRYRRLGR